MNEPRWFDDWELNAAKLPNRGTLVQVKLPHADPALVQFVLNEHQSVKTLNLLDRLLCELTGTKTTKFEVDNGPHTDMAA